MIVFDCADQKRMSGGVFALVVMILAVSFIHGSYALKCYYCESPLRKFCDDPLDKNNSHVQQVTCAAKYKGCGSARGTAWNTSKNSIQLIQALTGHCAIVQWDRRPPPSTNTGAPWPLRNFLTCALRRKILLSLWPLAYAPSRDDY